MLYFSYGDDDRFEWDSCPEWATRYKEESGAIADIKRNGLTSSAKAVYKSLPSMLGPESCWVIQSDNPNEPSRFQRQKSTKQQTNTEVKPMTQQQQQQSKFKGRVYRPSNQQAPIANPFQDEDKSDIVDKISSGLSKTFSPGGLIMFGAGVFGSGLLMNMGFWGSVFSGMPVDRHLEKMLMGEWAIVGAVVAGWGLSWGTTLFQTYPYVGKKGGEAIVKQYVASLFRPDLTKYKGGDYQIAKEHNAIARDFWKFMGIMWLICTFLEVAGGLIFVGDVFGKGLSSLLAMGGFIYSIAGCQWGAYLMVMGNNMRLGKEGRGAIARIHRAATDSALSQLK